MSKKSSKLIPLDKIDNGIKACLQNAQRIIKACETVFYAKTKVGDFSVVDNAPEISVILYYYALEELGKALKLEEEKFKAETSGEPNVNVESWFLNHNKKLDAVITKFGTKYHIFEADPIPLSPPGKFEFQSVEYSNPSIEKFMDRSKLLLTDFDEKKQEWGRFLEMATSHEIEIKLSKFKKLLIELQSFFDENKKFPLI